MLTTVSGADIDSERIYRPYIRPFTHAAELNYVHEQLDIWYLEVDIHATENDLGSTHVIRDDKLQPRIAEGSEGGLIPKDVMKHSTSNTHNKHL